MKVFSNLSVQQAPRNLFLLSNLWSLNLISSAVLFSGRTGSMPCE